MALLATFIGVGRHQDPNVRELGGARRDAKALWALFTDTLPAGHLDLLTDENATAQNIRTALATTLGSATPHDTVLLTFSGHGTHDHRLVAFDTNVGALEATAIPMQELVELFRASRASVIVCVLDCCFSGGAPARVLEHSAVPRSPSPPYLAISGQGRVLLTASKHDEAAYELPGVGHGLLTKALLDVLQAGAGSVSLIASMDEVQARVRAEAIRLGVAQTPVLLGTVEGGLTFPVLRRGPKFFAEFPESTGAKVGAAIAELKAFGIPDAFLTEWAATFSGGLNDLQLQAINEHRILDGDSLLVIAPTSSGKTFIGELAAARATAQGRKSIFLLPYRALANEKFDQFSRLYGDAHHMRVVRCSGDYQDQVDEFKRGRYDLALLTYEMFLNLALSSPSLLNPVGLVVLDEAQFITDPRRGIAVELLLTQLLVARRRGILPQLLVLSAVIGDVNKFDEWLGCKKMMSSVRPVKLVEGVLDRSGTFEFLGDDGPTTKQLLPVGSIRVRREQPSAQDVIVPLVRNLVADGEQVIVFRNTRGPAQGCAAYLADELQLPQASEALSALPTLDPTGAAASLRKCLSGGTAFHNSNLTRDERVVVERAFRNPHGNVRVLAATTTVAAGINTPASTVILAEQEFLGDDGRPFTVAEYKNMAGRAGRLGFNEHGKSIILADTPFQREELFRRYVLGKLEPLASSFDPNHLDTWLIRLLTQVNSIKRDEAPLLLANTFGGFLASQRNPQWLQEVQQQIEELMNRMQSLSLLEPDGDRVRLTLLGQACGRSGLKLGSAMRLVELLRARDSEILSAEELMALVQVLPEADQAYTPVFKRGQKEAERVRQASGYYGQLVVAKLQSRAKDTLEWFARCKRAALLWEWVHGASLESIELKYSTTPFQGKIEYGDIRRIADMTRQHLRSAFDIATIVLLDRRPSEDDIEQLLLRLEVGLPADALDLLSLPIQFPRGIYLALRQAQIRRAHEALNAERPFLVSIIGEVTTALLDKYRPRNPSGESLG